MQTFLLQIAKLLFLLLLPFVALIRGSVFFHEQYHLNGWMALLGGVGVSAMIIFIYMVYWQGSMAGKLGTARSLRRRYWLSVSLVLVYCFPGLLYLSATNAKHEEVRSEYHSLHPILRLGISTLVFLDQDLLLTDANRFPDDYRRMGLATKSHSLHYRQRSGFAHAVDIRTIGHHELRNRLVETYFRIMGFRTLRHVGTADHLHVSLMSHDRPGGI